MGHIATPGRRCDGDGNQRWHCPFAAGPLLATGELGLPPPAVALAGMGWTAGRGPWRQAWDYSAIWRRVASPGAHTQTVDGRFTPGIASGGGIGRHNGYAGHQGVMTSAERSLGEKG